MFAKRIFERLIVTNAVCLFLACGADDTNPPECTPSCSDRACGDDGCGGSCGECDASQTCNESSGQCEATPCTSCDCGDGVVSAGEACDDGNSSAGDYCSADCSSVTGACGDGEAQGNEACDDDNTEGSDYCASDCMTVTGSCGDGTKQGNEVCDDGNRTSGDACAADCKSVDGRCGDGDVESGEACDDGNTSDGDYCSADCEEVSGRCGDDVVQTNEQCDDGNTDAGDACASDCGSMTSACGDGTKHANEACDDGNTSGGDYCAADCKSATGSCGDGSVQGNETCDDGNTSAGDYCAADCESATGSCGDGTQQTNEACDDGNTSAGDYCAADCKSATGSCGDGTQQSNEACDDDNTDAGDYCAADCKNVTGSCGDGTQQSNEACDDDNTDAGDYCSANCQSVTGSCGDGTKQSIEACDDGGSNSDSTPDACRTTCELPECGDAVKDTGEACDDGNTAFGDYCGGTCVSITGSCGDGIRQSNELCDGTLSPDHCTSTCGIRPRVMTSGSTTCALNASGQVKCWGFNASGQLGLGNTVSRGDDANEMGSNLPVVNLGTASTCVSIDVGGYHVCGLFSNGNVKCWGRNDEGQLGVETISNVGTQPQHMGNSLMSVHWLFSSSRGVSSSGWFNCSLSDSVTCWGLNFLGQLGVGDTTNRGDYSRGAFPSVSLGQNAKAVATGGSHACAILANGSVKCWGDNFEGQLGLGDIDSRGDNANEMGSNLPVVSLGTGRTALAIAAGGSHTCALLDDHSVKCWGANSSGQLGLGDTSKRGDQANEMGDNLPPLDFGAGRTVQQLTVGAGHGCVILDDQSLKCWGDNAVGQLGLQSTTDRGDNANEMGANLPVVNLGTGRTARWIDAGGWVTCALLDDDSIKCWGYGENGALGLGSRSDWGDQTFEMGDNLPVVNVW